MLNALEHGNFGMSYARKTELIEGDAWAGEMARLEGLPENRTRFVTVRLERTAARIRFTIQDQGAGFDWQAFLEPDPERLFDSHGRGILLAQAESFDRVE